MSESEFDLTCKVTVGLMPRYFDDELPERQAVRLEQHLMVCPGCTTYLDQLRRTVAAVAGLRGDRRPGQVWEGLAARLLAGGDPGVESADQVVAYKFLAADRTSPFARVRWPEPGAGWVVASAAVGTCRPAVHACRVLDLAYWVGETLWRVELAGQVVESPSKIAAERGRLIEEVAGWPEASRDFIQDCSARLEQLRDQADEQAKEQRDYRVARFLARYLKEIKGDSELGIAEDSDPASVAYTVAHAAGIVGWTQDEAKAAKVHGEISPLDSERHRQSRWLAAQLGLAP